MTTTKGYYSIVQYCPDPSRLESVNIGVVLFCPEREFLRARLARSSARVRKLFGKQDWKFLAMQKVAVEARLAREEQSFRSLEDFESYIVRRANAILLTTARPVKVAEPEQELQDLFERLVGENDPTRRARRVDKELSSLFHEAGVERMLTKPEIIELPKLKHPVKAPYAYQNGRFNLIEPMQFEEAAPATVFSRASVRAVEGEFLSEYEHPEYGQLGLVVVAKFGPDQKQERQTAQAIFQKHNVALYTFDNLAPLLADIRKSAARH